MSPAGPVPVLTASALGLVACLVCGQVCRRPGSRVQVPAADRYCPRCGAKLHRRKPDSYARSWAFLIAAVLLYLPANLLPIMRTSTFFEADDDTILSGVIVLWQAGSWDLALIVFVASIVVPLLKLGALALLLITARSGSQWRTAERARLFRIIEKVGHWSMLDVFVVALLIALVHFKSLAQVEAGPGVVAFAAVVVLTMLASMSFDPRLIWDSYDPRR